MTGKIHSSHSEFMTGILHRPHELTRPLLMRSTSMMGDVCDMVTFFLCVFCG